MVIFHSYVSLPEGNFWLSPAAGCFAGVPLGASQDDTACLLLEYVESGTRTDGEQVGMAQHIVHMNVYTYIYIYIYAVFIYDYL